MELLLDFGLCDVFTLYNPESIFVDILLSTTLDFQESLSLYSPLDFLTKKQWTLQGTCS